MQVYSLFDLNEHIRQVLALNFQQPVWIAAEIAQVGQSRGHTYFELVQKGEGAEPIAQAQAVLWAADYRRLLRSIGPTLEAILIEGLEVKIRVQVDFHERYGLKLQIVDVDPTFTFGQLSLQRRETLEVLRKKGLLEKNRKLPLPLVLQRIAIISSETAAGLQDFNQHLLQNIFGYQFDCQLFTAAMQGRNAESEIQAAAALIEKRVTDFDCVAILRGGGARLDLAAFDGLQLCQAVAHLPLPVLVGIGHDVDETVLDLVAHSSLKTPTAVADFIVQHNAQFEGAVLGLSSQLAQLSTQKVRYQALAIQGLESALQWGLRDFQRKQTAQLESIERNLPIWVKHLLQRQTQQLDQALLLCHAMHPDKVLQRGYSITTKNGELLRSPSEIVSGDILTTRLQDGTIQSKAL
jgi:exodeoxyribonuclease VII large subunit